MNPWEKFEKDYKINDQGEGVVKNITDFALFISIRNLFNASIVGAAELEVPILEGLSCAAIVWRKFPNLKQM